MGMDGGMDALLLPLPPTRVLSFFRVWLLEGESTGACLPALDFDPGIRRGLVNSWRCMLVGVGGGMHSSCAIAPCELHASPSTAGEIELACVCVCVAGVLT